MEKTKYLLVIPMLISLCSCVANYEVNVLGNSFFILNDIKSSYESGETVSIRTPSFYREIHDIVFKINGNEVVPTIDDYAHFEFEINSNVDFKIEVNGSIDFKLIKDLDEYKNFDFSNVVKVEYSSFDDYMYNPRTNYVSTSKKDVDLIVSKFYSPVFINNDSLFIGGLHRNFKLITSSGESIVLDTYDKYLKNQEYKTYLSFNGNISYDSIYYNFGSIPKLKIIENNFDGTSTELDISNISFVKIDEPKDTIPILITESIGANFECMEVYDKATFSLKGTTFKHYYKLTSNFFTELIS